MTESFCKICGSKQLVHVWRRDRVSVFQNVVYSSKAAALQAPTGVLDLWSCSECGYLYNAAYESSKAVCGPEYTNDQTKSILFRDHVKWVARQIERCLPEKAGVLEIACGQGDFLREIASDPRSQNLQFFGYDPASRGIEPSSEKVKIFPRLFDSRSSAELRTAIGLVVMRHAIGYVSDPLRFLGEVRAISSEPFDFFLELQSLEWIVSHTSVWDLSYEQCSYFTANTIITALTKSNFSPIEITECFFDQYLLVKSQANHHLKCADAANKQYSRVDIELFRDAIARQVAEWSQRLSDASRSARVAIWGGATKGVMFCTECDPKGDTIEVVVDINPDKQNRFVPLTGHKILAPEEAARRGIGTVFVINPAYAEEVAAKCSVLGWRPKLEVL